MAKLEEKVKNVLKNENINRDQLKRSSERYEKLIAKGVVDKTEYNLPLNDTIGRAYFFEKNKSRD
ncbi:hypothetical protein GCM10023210_03980 [Chryseobacterium ginsengisoli]|uniref:Uncharacterized protein n=1 Tax=Chryseobacterium ginsengisoli TaxID=363853 RepID=A0ABP9LW10_9FLAO